MKVGVSVVILISEDEGPFVSIISVVNIHDISEACSNVAKKVILAFFTNQEIYRTIIFVVGGRHIVTVCIRSLEA